MPNIWIPLLVAVYCAGFYSLLFTARFSAPHSTVSLLLIWGGSSGLAMLWHSISIYALIKNGSGDSFYHLGLVPRLGLAALSTILVFLLFWLSALKSKTLIGWFQAKVGSLIPALAIDAPVTVLLFVLLYSLSPQIYYAYYQLIIPGLPLQWVAGEFATLDSLNGFIAMHGITRFSELLAALSFWVLSLSFIWQYLANLACANLKLKRLMCAIAFGAACFSWQSMFHSN